MTDTQPDAAALVPANGTSPTPLPVEPAGLASWVVSTDHKRVGRMYAVVAALLLIGAVVVGALLGWEKVDTDDTQIIGSGVATAAQWNSLYQLGLVFLGVTPLLLGLAIAVVPLQVGARAIAFPRAAAASFWLWLFGAGLLIGTYVADGGPGGGDSDAVALFITALGLVVLGLLLGAICVATTVLTLRVPGMDLERVPAFAWASMVSGFVLLLTLPALLADLIFHYVDVRYGGAGGLADLGFGGSEGLIGTVVWTTRQPQVYAYALPALGIIADVVPVFARARQQLAWVGLVAIGFGGFVGLGSFAQLPARLDLVDEPAYVALSLLAVLPVLVVLALGGLTMASSKPRLGAPLVGILPAGLLLLAGAAAGAAGSIEPFHLSLTAWDDGQTTLVLLGAALAALVGFVHWGPKLSGHLVADAPAKGLLTLGFLAVLLAAVPLLVAGIIDQPTGAVTFIEEDASAFLNALSAIGLSVVALLALAALGLLLKGLASGAEAGPDPWEGHTLEWSTTSPPPAGNFAQPLPMVTSDRPLLDVRDQAPEAAG